MGQWEPGDLPQIELALQKHFRSISCFLNMGLKNEGFLPTQSEQAFEAMTILPMAKAIAVIAQK